MICRVFSNLGFVGKITTCDNTHTHIFCVLIRTDIALIIRLGLLSPCGLSRRFSWLYSVHIHHIHSQRTHTHTLHYQLNNFLNEWVSSHRDNVVGIMRLYVYTIGIRTSFALLPHSHPSSPVRKLELKENDKISPIPSSGISFNLCSRIDFSGTVLGLAVTTYSIFN